MTTDKIIVIVGPTASGKSELSVRLAKKFSGEIISVDSRQIYRGLNIGSGKVEGQWQTQAGHKVFIYKGIPHYLIDEASPRTQYSVEKFQNKARTIIQKLLAKGKVPILCGGTMHWIDAIIFEQTIPQVKPNTRIRRQLSKLGTEQMFTMLKKLDPTRAKNIDSQNPHRLIRALEIVMTTGKPVPPTQSAPIYQAIWLGLKPEQEVLEKKIHKRLKQRLDSGLIEEVQELRKSGLSWKKLEGFGLEYRYCALYLQEKITKQQLEEQLFIAIRQYAKRQMTWWKKNKSIRWFADASEALKAIDSISF